MKSFRPCYRRLAHAGGQGCHLTCNGLLALVNIVKVAGSTRAEWRLFVKGDSRMLACLSFAIEQLHPNKREIGNLAQRATILASVVTAKN
jgi:hypothetical protein